MRDRFDLRRCVEATLGALRSDSAGADGEDFAAAAKAPVEVAAPCVADEREVVAVAEADGDDLRLERPAKRLLLLPDPIATCTSLIRRASIIERANRRALRARLRRKADDHRDVLSIPFLAH
jgi:hypothetical protein